MDIYYIAQEYLASEVPGATDVLLTQQLRLAAIEFCSETNIYTSSIQPVTLISGQQQYTLTPIETTTEIIRPVLLWVGSRLLAPVAARELNAVTVILNSSGEPAYYTFNTPNVVSLFPTPGSFVSDQLNGRVVVTPAMTATTIPDWMALRFMDALLAGAKARLFAMQNKPWSQFELSVKFGRMFSACVTNAKIEANKSLTSMDLVVWPRSR